MKGLLKILIAVFAVCLIAPAFSAVENVKVGGDIGIYGVLRGDFDIEEGNEDLHFFQTSARVYVSADLSENVSAMIRLINERNWGSYIEGDVNPNLNPNQGINLDLAYIKVSDLLTPGLNLTVGRQEIELGEGLVVGSAYNAYNYPVYLGAPDLGLQKAFDAVKIDYSASAIPLNITAFLSKINEAYYDDNDEATLYGLNVGYKVGEIANIDVYYVREAVDDPEDITLDTAGLRVVAGIPSITGLSLKAEYAKQFGDVEDVDFKGSALLLGASYQFATNMEPQIKVNYLLVSGQKPDSENIDRWVDVAPSNIGSRVGPLLYAYGAYNGLPPYFGLSIINFGFSIKPVEKVKVALDGYLQKTDEKVFGYDKIAREIDLSIEYKHTEDLTFGLTLGKLLADDIIEYIGGDDAWQAIVSMKISF